MAGSCTFSAASLVAGRALADARQFSLASTGPSSGGRGSVDRGGTGNQCPLLVSLAKGSAIRADIDCGPRARGINRIAIHARGGSERVGGGNERRTYESAQLRRDGPLRARSLYLQPVGRRRRGGAARCGPRRRFALCLDRVFHGWKSGAETCGRVGKERACAIPRRGGSVSGDVPGRIRGLAP